MQTAFQSLVLLQLVSESKWLYHKKHPESYQSSFSSRRCHLEAVWMARAHVLANAIPPQKSKVWIDDVAVDTHGFTAWVKFGCAKCAMIVCQIDKGVHLHSVSCSALSCQQDPTIAASDSQPFCRCLEHRNFASQCRPLYTYQRCALLSHRKLVASKQQIWHCEPRELWRW